MNYKRKTVDIFISDEIKSLLLSIKDDSIVAKMLLKKRQQLEDLVDNYVNYISISKQDMSKISYLTQDRIETISGYEYWTSPRRYQAKPGAFISKIYKNINPKEIENFSNLFKSVSLKPKFTFSVVNGDIIKRYYHVDSYSTDRGSLGVSCMKHDKCQGLLDIYTKNDKVSMLIMLDEFGKLMGRALLWNIEPNKIMDRIYTIDDESLRFYFKKWATDNNFWYKSEQNWYNTLQFEQLGKKRTEFKIKVELNEFELYPYMDTFKFIDTKTGDIFNYIPKDKRIKILVSCDGSKYDGDYLKFDSIDRVFRYNGDCCYVQYLNIYTHSSNVRWSRLNEQYILYKDCKYVDEIDDYIFTDRSKNRSRESTYEIYNE